MRLDRFAQTVAITLKGAAILLFVVVGGCRQQPTTVSGAVTLDGRPLAVPADARGTVVFQPDGGHGTMATGLLDPTGHFKLATGSSPEVARGKYYVTVSVSQLLPKSENQEQGAKLITPAKYASAQDSGLVSNVEAGENQVTFDLVSSHEGEIASPTEPDSDVVHSNDAQSPQSPIENK